MFDAWQTACVYADALAVSAAPERAWRARQASRLARLLDEVVPASALYRARWTDAPHLSAHERLARVPVITRRELMRHFDAWVTDPALARPALEAFVQARSRRGAPLLGRYHVWESSGSSGEPAIYVQDARALAVADAIEAARGPLTRWRPGARIALVAATEGHYAGVVAFERLRAINPWLASALRSFSFLQPLPQLVHELQAFAPDVLASYPSMAWVLAQEQAAGRLRLALDALATGGETLTPATRRELGRVFGAPVHDSYGASECFFIASPCRAGALHLNADWAVLEPVDAQGRPVPEGTVGHTTLLTNLANQVQPIVRYDLGDRVRFVPGRCTCGGALPRIEVEGRADDVLSLLDDSGHAVHLAPLALVTVLEEEAGVFDFVLRERTARALVLELGAGGAAAAGRAGAALRAYLRSVGLAGVRLTVNPGVPATAPGRSGKRQRVVARPRARG